MTYQLGLHHPPPTKGAVGMLRLAGRAAGLAVVALTFAAWSPGLAQGFDEPIGPRQVQRWLAREGFADISRPRLVGDVYVVEALSQARRRYRFMIDAETGEILEDLVIGVPERETRRRDPQVRRSPSPRQRQATRSEPRPAQPRPPARPEAAPAPAEGPAAEARPIAAPGPGGPDSRPPDAVEAQVPPPASRPQAQPAPAPAPPPAASEGPEPWRDPPPGPE
jgi:hypothetical protein